MYVEAFHRVLKYIYMKGKVNKRLDKCIFVLLKLARDKGFERLVKIEKGKNTERIRLIRSRHQKSMELSFAQIEVTKEDNVWKLSSSDNSNVYHVTLQHEECLNVCSLCCPDCNVCVHMYTCTCPDSLIWATICKHIHLIARYISQKSSSNKPNDKHLLENLRNESKDQIDSLKWQVHTEVLGLAAQVHLINNIDVLKSVISYIRSASNLIKMDKEMHTLPLLPSNNTEPSTKPIKP